ECQALLQLAGLAEGVLQDAPVDSRQLAGIEQVRVAGRTVCETVLHAQAQALQELERVDPAAYVVLGEPPDGRQSLEALGGAGFADSGSQRQDPGPVDEGRGAVQLQVDDRLLAREQRLEQATGPRRRRPVAQRVVAHLLEESRRLRG